MIELRSDIAGVILAGGKSSRMGQDKALLGMNGKPFIQQIAEELQKVFTRVIIVSDRAVPYKFLDLPVYEDIFKNCGPLAGIHSAFSHSRSDKIFVVSTDTPLINPGAIRYLLDLQYTNEAIVYSIDDAIQPLFGIYDRTCLSLLEDHLTKKQYSVLKFIKSIDTNIIPASSVTRFDVSQLLMNINTQEDYRCMLRNSFLDSSGDV